MGVVYRGVVLMGAYPGHYTICMYAVCWWIRMAFELHLYTLSSLSPINYPPINCCSYMYMYVYYTCTM